MRHTKYWLLIAAFVLVVAMPVFAQDGPTITIAENEALGPYLADASGRTLYVFDRDTINVSNCTGQCAENWPPLTVESADALSAAEGIPGMLGTIEREDGTLQVTYNGWPLYYWSRDEAAGDVSGHRVGRVWWVATPATVSVGGNADLGRFLVGPNGMTLYLFLNDEPGVSNCTGDCATNWPPLTVESADALSAGVNVPGELATIERDDGTLQVTYNGRPLYYWAQDAAIGDATGEGRGDVWFVVRPETVVIGGNDELGAFLTSADGMTLYTFANDEPGVSNCTDQCLENWPPLTVASEDALVGASDLMGELGVIDRGDGTLQVTYNGMPLYFWIEDTQPGDATGHNRGDVWFVATP